MKILCKILALTLMAALLVGCFAGCCCTIPGSLLNRVTEVEKQEAQKTETLAPGISVILPEENTPEYEEPEYDSPETLPVYPAPAPEDDQIHIYTLVPDYWENPGCWAWQGETQKNAYTQWPGVSMVWNGNFYETTAPSWVDYVIINGIGGSVQTEDILISSGYDIWIIVDSYGEYYQLYYYKPSGSELSAMGY